MSEEKKKVLLVEDDQAISDMYKLSLEENGFEVLLTEKGSEALAIAQEQKPAIILLDVILPEVDGFSILQTLKAQTETKKIPVLLLTNLSQESDQEKGKELGAAAYLVKSQHTPSEVISEIKTILSE